MNTKNLHLNYSKHIFLNPVKCEISNIDFETISNQAWFPTDNQFSNFVKKRFHKLRRTVFLTKESELLVRQFRSNPTPQSIKRRDGPLCLNLIRASFLVCD